MIPKRVLRGVVTALALTALFGCIQPPPPAAPNGVGGLKSEDATLISKNGFDIADHASDRNDYAWSMAYFHPGFDAPEYVYVGTGNDMIGLIYEVIAIASNPDTAAPVASRAPEIRRYRGDLAADQWETVLDFGDFDPATTPKTVGFRTLGQYQSPSDGVTHLYAGTYGERPQLWRSATGDLGTWELFWETEGPGSFRSLHEHDGLLYVAFTQELTVGAERIGKIFVTDGFDVTPVVTDGFDNPNNIGVMFLESFNGALYAGTLNDVEGYEVWKLEGVGESLITTRVIAAGGPSAANEAAITACVFGEHLYVGCQLSPVSNVTSGLKAADLVRVAADDSWETVVGPNSLSGLDSGFDHWPNSYIWSMVTEGGWLYAATYDQVSPFFNMLSQPVRLIKALTGAKRANLIERVGRAGADLYKTQDGVTWYPVTLDGFGDAGNYGFRTMISTGDAIFIGTANPFDGLEIWRGELSD